MSHTEHHDPRESDAYDSTPTEKSFPKKQRRALPGSAKSDKHTPTKRGEPISSPHLIGKWSPR